MGWLIRALPFIAVGFFVWWVMDLRADLKAAQAEIATKERSIVALRTSFAQSSEARRVDAARAAAQRERDREAAVTVEQILTAKLGECADAPLDPDFAAILNGLRPTNGN